MENLEQEINSLKSAIRDVPDFPKEGIIFKDITTLLQDPVKFKRCVDLLVAKYLEHGIDAVVAIEARGFILGGAVAYHLGAGFVPVRKKGKLPYKIHEVTYDLEYGTDTLTIHQDAVKPDSRVLIVDDLLATGGTTNAGIQLLEKSNAQIVGAAFLIELTFLEGRQKLQGHDIFSLIKY